MSLKKIGAPRKGEERTQQEIEGELQLWELSRRRKSRQMLTLRKPGSNPFVGRTLNGESWFRASCGHVVRNNKTKMCRRCWFEKCEATGTRTAFGGWKSNPYVKGERIALHREVAEQTLGRKLKPNEVVHHVNMNKTDNRRRNLLICTRAYHRLLHYRMQLVVAARIRLWQDQQGA